MSENKSEDEKSKGYVNLYNIFDFAGFYPGFSGAKFKLEQSMIRKFKIEKINKLING